MSDSFGSILGAVATGALGGSALGPIGAGGGAALALATKLAPQLGKWIGVGDSETIGKVVNTVQALVGNTPPADHTQLNIGTATALTAQLAQIAADRDAVLRDAKIAMLQTQLSDVQNARQQTMELAKLGSPMQWGAAVISAIVLLTFGLVVGIALLHPIAPSSYSEAILNILLGTLGTLTTAVVTYWVGSSAGSATKTHMLAAQRDNTNVRPIPTPQPIAWLPSQPLPPSGNDVPIPASTLPVQPFLPLAPAPVAKPRPAPDRAAFFASLRNSGVFGAHLTQHQVDGCNTLLDYWNSNMGGADRRWLAYCMGTACWETGYTMQPVEEVGKGAGHPYGPKYYGRGYVQLTWEENYKKAGAALGIDLVTSPERTLEPNIAAAILFRGMSEGWFTGHTLSGYFSNDANDPVGARAIVNGMDDHAADIAKLYQVFLTALDAEGVA